MIRSHRPAWSLPTFCVATILLCSAVVQAHFCGPIRIDLKVGEAYAWRITADHLETDSKYSPVLEGPPGVVVVTPLSNFMARHGDFVIVARAPGTNTLSVAWSYDPTGGRGFCDVVIVVSTNQGSGTAVNSLRPGVITTRGGALSITASDLKEMLDQFIPAAAKKLFVFTQCYGGSIAFDTLFMTAANLAIASATATDQTGKYGGYHDDAARELKPQAGRTAAQVHETASQGKMTVTPPEGGLEQSQQMLHDMSEWPVTSGGLSLSEFSLEPVSATGAVKSRHIVVFMGQPEKKQVYVQVHNGSVTIPDSNGTPTDIDDVADRDVIKNNFKNEPNTTVTTAGGDPSLTDATKGQTGWDYPGDADGLKKAIKAAGDAIRNSPDPAAEQFILFVGDHGGQGVNYIFIPTVIQPSTSFKISVDPSLVSGKDAFTYTIKLELNNQTGIGVTATPAASPPGQPSPQGISQAKGAGPTGLEIELNIPGEPPVILSASESGAFDLNDDGRIDSAAGDHWNYFFPVDESLVVRRLLDGGYDVVMHNRSLQALTVRNAALLSGAISRPAYTIPPPLITAVRRTGTQVVLTVKAPPFESFDLQNSSDLKQWTRVRSVFFQTETSEVTATLNSTSPAVFFRFVRALP